MHQYASMLYAEYQARIVCLLTVANVCISVYLRFSYDGFD